ncbi:MAG TPA: hypothetical protein DEH22_11495 [Chloroflexi bacterium]|nr:hypothetical protein [Chloroflexota bacterium]
MIAMNIYYTAKDIEELAAKGVKQLELSPGVILTDFARETAQQFNIALIKSEMQTTPAALPISPSKITPSEKYNKPTGCQHASNALPVVHSQAVTPSNPSIAGAGSNTVNKLIDLMGKVVKRGG